MAIAREPAQRAGAAAELDPKTLELRLRAQRCHTAVVWRAGQADAAFHPPSRLIDALDEGQNLLSA